MIALIQRVQSAYVDINQQRVAQISQGLLILLGIEKNDTAEHVDKLCHKVGHYRVFADDDGQMNCNIQQVRGQALVVSQFTLAANTHKGLRPSFSEAAPPEQAQKLYEQFVQKFATIAPVKTGEFAADMQVGLVNDGPVTFWLQV